MHRAGSRTKKGARFYSGVKRCRGGLRSRNCHWPCARLQTCFLFLCKHFSLEGRMVSLEPMLHPSVDAASCINTLDCDQHEWLQLLRERIGGEWKKTQIKLVAN